VDHVISQPKIRDLFKQNTSKVDILVDTLLTLISAQKDPDSSEILTRLISHLAFCATPMTDDTFSKLIKHLQSQAFTTQRETLKL
jgi:hypothetical protein